MIRRILPCVAVALLLSACSGLERSQDAQFSAPLPTEAEARQALDYVGGQDLPLPRIQLATVHQIEDVSQALSTPVGSFYYRPAHVIVLGYDWQFDNLAQEMNNYREAVEYERGLRSTPPSECDGARIAKLIDEERGWYRREHMRADTGLAAFNCRRVEHGWQIGIN